MTSLPCEKAQQIQLEARMANKLNYHAEAAGRQFITTKVKKLFNLKKKHEDMHLPTLS